MKDVGAAGFAGSLPPFLGRERAAVDVDVGPERRSPRYHETCLALESVKESTSGRIHSELLRLLFLHAHRETTLFFEIFEDEHAQPHTSRFQYRRVLKKAILSLNVERENSGLYSIN